MDDFFTGKRILRAADRLFHTIPKTLVLPKAAANFDPTLKAAEITPVEMMSCPAGLIADYGRGRSKGMADTSATYEGGQGKA